MSTEQQTEHNKQTKKTEQNKRFIYEDDAEMMKPFNWDVLRRLGHYMKPYKAKMLPIILLMLVGAATRLTVPIIISIAIDEVIDPSSNFYERIENLI